MKTLIAAISLSLLSIGAFAQSSAKTTGKSSTKTTSKTTAKTATASAIYRCPTCNYSSDKAGECSKDKIALVKVGDYYCPDCYMSQSKPGKCSMCGVEMKKMEAAPAKK